MSHIHHYGDEVEAWLERHRGVLTVGTIEREVMNQLLSDYRAHIKARVPLSEEVDRD